MRVTFLEAPSPSRAESAITRLAAQTSPSLSV